MNVKEALNWRYAVKKFSNKTVSPDTVTQVTEAINLTASSAGLQPYRLLIVNNKELQQQLGEGSFNPQIADASHLVVFAAFENITQAHIDDYMDRIAAVRQVPVESLKEFKTVLESYFLKLSPEDIFTWAARQAYIGLGTGLIAAAELKVDATPMEGFDRTKFDELLGLKEKGLKSVVIMALGYRDEENDVFSKLKKVRLPIEEFAIQ
ncbi:MAG: NAD(P)H-dependent oxidoreductase [Ferruginibacter sp.]